MKHSILFSILVLLIVSCNGNAQTNHSLAIQSTISLPDIKGRIDHLCFDEASNRIFLVSPGCDMLAVVDLKKEKEVFSTNTALDEPQGIVFLEKTNQLFVSNGGDGTCRIFNAENYQLEHTLELGDDADNIRFWKAHNEIFVAYGNGGIAIFNAADFSKTGDIKLKGHPESFQLDTIRQKLFVNIPGRNVIDEVDLVSKSVSNEWKLKGAGSNFTMGIDMPDHLLFVGCRNGSQMLTIDYTTGTQISTSKIGSDADYIFFDTTTRKVFVSCGSGELSVFSLDEKNIPMEESAQSTGSGARTCLLIPSLKLLVVAKPRRLGTDAALLLYKIAEIFRKR